MSWDGIGAVAEIVGAAAVVVTLIFLTLQIRQNTASVRQQCYNDIFVRRQEILLRISESQELHRIWSRALRGERITADEGNRFTFIQAQMLKHLEDCFVQYKAGVITRPIWESEKGVMATAFALPGFLAWWKEAQQFFLPEFVAEMARHRPLPLVLYDETTGTWGRPGGPPAF